MSLSVKGEAYKFGMQEGFVFEDYKAIVIRGN